MSLSDELLQRALLALTRIESHIPAAPNEINWQTTLAARWRKSALPWGKQGYFQAIRQPHSIQFSDLRHIDEQKEVVFQNTRQFVLGLAANHILLTGARGTGKSSLIKACLHEFAAQGLRLIEVDKDDLIDLADIVEALTGRDEKFIVFCDDLSFEANESAYKSLKVALDGSLSAAGSQVLIYASSNRRHLIPEKFSDSHGTYVDDEGDLHPSETVEERIALSERFGIWLSFYSFTQEAYLNIVGFHLSKLGCTHAHIEAARTEALQWALQRGSRSGRVAQQFARDYAGRILVNPESK